MLISSKTKIQAYKEKEIGISAKLYYIINILFQFFQIYKIDYLNQFYRTVEVGIVEKSVLNTYNFGLIIFICLLSYFSNKCNSPVKMTILAS